MTGPWLIGFIALWVLMVGVCALLAGALGQLALIRKNLQRSNELPEVNIPPVEYDGPPIGSRLPQIELASVNGFDPPIPRGRADLLHLRRRAQPVRMQHPVNADMPHGAGAPLIDGVMSMGSFT